MKSEEFFEMLNDIDDNFVDAALPNAEKKQVIQPQEIRMAKRRFPWGIAAAAACLAVCAAVGTVIAVNMDKGKIPVESNSPLQSGAILSVVEEIYTEDSGKELPLVFEFDEIKDVKTFSGINISEDSDAEMTERLNIYLTNPATNAIDPRVIISGVIKQLYAADLNSDGYREVVAAVNDFGKNANGSSAGYYMAYDIINGQGYQFVDGGANEENRLPYDHLLMKDGKLYMRSYDSSAISSEPLTLDIMKKVSYNTDSFETVFDENVYKDSFTMPEFPGSKFYVDSSSISVKRPDRDLVKITEGDIRSIFLWDMDGDGKREILVTFNGVRSYISAFSAELSGWGGWSYENYYMGHDYAFVAKGDGIHVLCDGEDEGLVSLDRMGRIEDEPDSPIERIIDVGHYSNNFTMPEFPNLDFTIDEDGNVTMYNKISDIEEGHIVITNTGKLWLADLNDDGYREIISEGWGKNSQTYIQVYDIANGKHYSLTDIDDVHLSPSYDAVAVVYFKGSDPAHHWEYLTFNRLTETAISTGNNQNNPTTDPSESTEPEPLSSVFENDKLRLQVNLEKSAYKKGDIITVDAKVTNKSDKKFYIFVPTATADTHTEIRTYISLDGRRLNDIDAVRYWDDAIKLIPLEPGESFTLEKVRFDTTYTGDESLGISKQPVQSGLYQGTTEITILDSPGFETPAESYYTSFAISIM